MLFRSGAVCANPPGSEDMDCSALVTAQNTLGVRGWERVSPSLVGAQIDAVAEDLRPAAIKSGMLGDAEVVRAVASGIRRFHGAHCTGRKLLIVLPPLAAALDAHPEAA